MNARPWIFAACTLAVVTAAYVLTRPDSAVSEDSSTAETLAAGPEARMRRHGVSEPSSEESPGTAAGSTPPQPEVIRERIRRAIMRRHAPQRSVPVRNVDAAERSAGEEELPPGNLDPEYIQQTVREEVVPLVRECYDQLLETDDESSGRVVMQFDIMGDETVGGIVDDVTLTEESELTQEDFAECIRESMASAVFDPPDGGGVVSITYPMIFEPQPS